MGRSWQHPIDMLNLAQTKAVLMVTQINKVKAHEHQRLNECWLHITARQSALATFIQLF
jgi:hypothetical protein